MSGSLDGAVAIVTGAGRGIGRAEALRLAAEGASVVVNDVGGSLEGVGADDEPARVVAREIVDAGGRAIADTGDITEWATGRRLVSTALDRLDLWEGWRPVTAATVEGTWTMDALDAAREQLFRPSSA